MPSGQGTFQGSHLLVSVLCSQYCSTTVFPPVTKPIRLSLLLVIPMHGSTCAQVFSPPAFLLLTLPPLYSLVIRRPVHCQSLPSVPVSPLSQQCHCALIASLVVSYHGTLKVGTGSSSISWKLVKNAVSVSTPHLLNQRLGWAPQSVFE